ncbi:MAG TPA: hypothetical protein VN634_13730 [Candidatus Limnocylindrales bacterium]|nr:hypothetical protein [Candidatus Limnocylindrales bacterium]
MPSPIRPLSVALSSILCLSAFAARAAEPAKTPPAPAAPAAAAPAAPAAPAAAAPADSAALTPDKVVASYLKAMQEQRFKDAYQYVSTTLRAGKSVDEWAKEQQYVMQMGEVKIIDFKVYPAIIGADGVARVPNILKSQDKFLNQLGLDEHEIYELIKENGAWRIDQQTLAEGADRNEYFPDDAQKK